MELKLALVDDCFLRRKHPDVKPDDVPECWRTVLVPADAPLSWVHRVIQKSFNWYDYHLHRFSFLDFEMREAFEDLFKEALKSILQERLVELFGDKLDEAAVTAYTAAAHTRLTSVRSEPPTREQVVDMFTLALFYLTSWEEKVGGKSGIKLRKAWKSADWGALDWLRESGFVDCTNKAKSVTVTVDGAAEAELFFRVFDLGHLVNG